MIVLSMDNEKNIGKIISSIQQKYSFATKNDHMVATIRSPGGKENQAAPFTINPNSSKPRKTVDIIFSGVF